MENTQEELARTEFRSAMEKIITRYPYREIELKTLALIWEVTNFSDFQIGFNSFLPAKIPVLIGPTSTGKTFTVSEIGEDLGAFVKTILLQQENPDEVAGYMVPTSHVKESDGQNIKSSGEEENGYHLRYAKPEWFQELEGFTKTFRIVFLDELDKPPRELLSPLLTFMRNKVLRKWKVPFCTLLVGAMNPTELPLTDAFVARCIFIPWLHNQEHYSSLFPSLKDVIGSFSYDEAVTLPSLPKEPDLATLHFLDAAKKHPWFWDGKVRENIVRGMVRSESAEIILRVFENKLGPPVEVLIRSPELTRKVVVAMNEEDVFLLYREMHQMFCHQDPIETLVFGEFQYWVWEYGRMGAGDRAYKYQRFMGEVPLEEHTNFALHSETWNDVVKPKLNGDGTLENYKKSYIYAAQVNRWNLENPDRQIELEGFEEELDGSMSTT